MSETCEEALESVKSPSPIQWKRPSDVMKRLKRRSIISSKKSDFGSGFAPNSGISHSASSAGRDSSITLTNNILASPQGQSPSNKRPLNPFSCSPRKRLNLGSTQSQTSAAEYEDSDFKLFRLLEKSNPDIDEHEQDSSKEFRKLDDIVSETDSDNVDMDNKRKKPSESLSDRPYAVDLPIDWSLRQKVRFLSKSSFSWCNQLKTSTEAAGISQFVRLGDSLDENVDSLTRQKMELKRCCMYWCHPHIPWLKLFPRIVPDDKIGGKTSLLLNDTHVTQALHADWVQSFTSVYWLLRSQYCPYFYLCCHQFNVLFRTAGIGSKFVNALVTPTTRGFREALKKEGIEFNLPLLEREEDLEISVPDLKIDGAITRGVDDEVEEDVTTTDDGAQSWLESIGLDKKQFPELDPTKIKLQRDGHKKIDTRPVSTVYVEGAETQALFNYLLNCRSCFATTGVQAGVPPTILSPVAFRGATLKHLEVKTGLVRQDRSSHIGHTLEVIGPILPHTLHGLCRLFTQSQDSGFTARFDVHEQSTPFNVCGMLSNKQETLSNTGLDNDQVRHLTQDPTLNKTAIRDLEYNNRKYYWTL